MENHRQSSLRSPALTVLFITLTLSVRAWSAETVLHQFAGSPNDGANPTGGLVSDSVGNLYGTTFTGGTNGQGTIFKIDTSYHEIVLHNFTGGADGGFPAASLVFDALGNLYGTATCGGNSSCSGGIGGNGVVFMLTPAGTFTPLYAFHGSVNGDGSRPFAPLIFAFGNLFGTTEHGGTGNCVSGSGSGCGVIFKLSTSGSETVLYRFTGGIDGGRPLAPVVSDNNNNLYGTTFVGGLHGEGTVFKLDPANQETVLHPFTGGTDGGFPTAGLILDGAGNLYGTATCGGIRTCSGSVGGNGVVFEESASGTYTILHTFKGWDGANPNAGLVFSAVGNLYGTTFAGGRTGCNVSGTHGCGVVFKLQPVTRTYARVYAFTGGIDGANPYAGVILGAGLLADPDEPQKKGACTGACGATSGGGTSGNGVAYQVTPVQ